MMTDTIEKESFVKHLREETMRLHKEGGIFETDPGKKRKDPTLHEFIQMLEQRYLLHRCLEGLIQKHQHLPAIAGVWKDRYLHTKNLVRDLEFFERDLGSIKATAGTQSVIERMIEVTEKNPVAVLGHLYTFEGSNNGNRMLSEKYREIFSLPENGAGTYYHDPYGESQKEFWAEFKTNLENQVLSEAEKSVITEAALDIFRCMLQKRI